MPTSLSTTELSKEAQIESELFSIISLEASKQDVD